MWKFILFLVACTLFAWAIPAFAEIEVVSMSRNALSAIFFPDDPTFSVSDTRDHEGLGEYISEFEVSGFGRSTQSSHNTVAVNDGNLLSFAGHMGISWLTPDPAATASFVIQQLVDLYFSVPPGSDFSLAVEDRTGEVMTWGIWDADTSSSLFQSHSSEGNFETSGQLIGSGNYAFLVQLIGSSNHLGVSGTAGANFVFVVNDGVVAIENTTWGGIKSLYR